jgi:allantoinase
MTGLRSSRVLVGGELRPATIRVSDGVVVEVGEGPADLDFGDLVLMPGLVDSHVHVNEPGRADWEGFATATSAAIAGGTTTIVDMPLNSIPPTTTVPALEEKKAAASASISCDVAFWGGFTGDLSHLSGLVADGVCGFKSFLSDSGVEEFPSVSVDALAEGMRAMGALGVPALVHAEDPASLLPFEGDATSYAAYLASRPADAEVAAVRSVQRLAGRTGAAAHVLHVSSGEAAAVIGEGPATLSGETCPHYLHFCSSDVPPGATEFKCAPPIRASSEREALWDALGEGRLAMVVSDHSPSPPQLKTGGFEGAWGGISSLQLRLPVTWTGAAARGFGLADLGRWLAAAPARLAGLDDRKGQIAEGKDADIVLFDPDGVTSVDDEPLRHRHSLTPYRGTRLRGRVVATFLRGEQVLSQGRVTERRGRMLARK